MRHDRRLVGAMTMALLGLVCGTTPVCGQAGVPGVDMSRAFELRRITFELVKTPKFREAVSGASEGASISDRWLRVEAEFSTDLEWTDDLTVKYFVLMGEGRELRLFGGELVHINVKRDRRHYSGMFMHPNAVERYGRNKVQGVYVELWYRGQRVAMATEPATKTRWWEGREPASGSLLSPRETPWALVAHERYEAIKASK
jgi:hypothetical protein